MPTFPTSATREVCSGDICDLNGNPAPQWQKFAGGRNPNLLRSLRVLRSAMQTNLKVNPTQCLRRFKVHRLIIEARRNSKALE